MAEMNDYSGPFRPDLTFNDLSKDFLLKVIRIWQWSWLRDYARLRIFPWANPPVSPFGKGGSRKTQRGCAPLHAPWSNPQRRVSDSPGSNLRARGVRLRHTKPAADPVIPAEAGIQRSSLVKPRVVLAMMCRAG